VWSTIFSNGTVCISTHSGHLLSAEKTTQIYLRALGLTDAWTSLIWAIPATCGFLVQPVVGARSDLSHHRWGRRKPYMATGALGTMSSIIVLAWAGALGRWSVAFFAVHSLEAAATTTKIYAVLSICTLSLSIQPLQCGLRAIVLDQCPARQQVQAQSWVARLCGIGQIAGCVAGIVYLPDEHSLGDITTFRILAVASAIAVGVTVAITCASVREEINQQDLGEKATPRSLPTVLRNLVRTFTETRGILRRVFLIQSLSWMGWFSFLFYNTRYAYAHGFAFSHAR